MYRNKAAKASEKKDFFVVGISQKFHKSAVYRNKVAKVSEFFFFCGGDFTKKSQISCEFVTGHILTRNRMTLLCV